MALACSKLLGPGISMLARISDPTLAHFKQFRSVFIYIALSYKIPIFSFVINATCIHLAKNLNHLKYLGFLLKLNMKTTKRILHGQSHSWSRLGNVDKEFYILKFAGIFNARLSLSK